MFFLSVCFLLLFFSLFFLLLSLSSHPLQPPTRPPHSSLPHAQRDPSNEEQCSCLQSEAVALPGTLVVSRRVKCHNIISSPAPPLTFSTSHAHPLQEPLTRTRIHTQKHTHVRTSTYIVGSATYIRLRRHARTHVYMPTHTHTHVQIYTNPCINKARVQIRKPDVCFRIT